ncbi:hypothetical protein CAPTEDRAFT_221363 [Capitella teleta]|uniref:Uncharacterized protein n=1 Tax=Capitella teleta TaxID=283909 RepID=R7UNW1_CAPTE|nr:hypothetical protein CAPTEDRAFT_221363 [Capitella teleta]|eukprot:ELU07803.1 hypothetical protein CAPTEDRAFT_221363 [Capitella teleta]
MKHNSLVSDSVKSMAFVKGSAMRTVGPQRHPLQAPGSVPRFPPLNKAYDGIHGSAMAVPPPRVHPEEVKSSRSNTGSPSRSFVASRTESLRSLEEDRIRESREAMAREKQLKQQIVVLQKLVEDLKQQLKAKELVINELKAENYQLEEKYRLLYETEKADHTVTCNALAKTEADLQQSNERIEKLIAHHDKKIADLNTLMSSRLTDLTNTKNQEIAERDVKLDRLKKQMAEALKGNSWERQQQLDELTKELSRVSEECDMLRIRLKAASKSNKGGSCSNCESSQSLLSQAQSDISDRDQTIRHLKNLTMKFEKQVKQGSTLLGLTDKTHRLSKNTK